MFSSKVLKMLFRECLCKLQFTKICFVFLFLKRQTRLFFVNIFRCALGEALHNKPQLELKTEARLVLI